MTAADRRTSFLRSGKGDGLGRSSIGGDVVAAAEEATRVASSDEILYNLAPPLVADCAIVWVSRVTFLGKNKQISKGSKRYMPGEV